MSGESSRFYVRAQHQVAPIGRLSDATAGARLVLDHVAFGEVRVFGWPFTFAVAPTIYENHRTTVFNERLLPAISEALRMHVELTCGGGHLDGEQATGLGLLAAQETDALLAEWLLTLES